MLAQRQLMSHNGLLVNHWAVDCVDLKSLWPSVSRCPYLDDLARRPLQYWLATSITRFVFPRTWSALVIFWDSPPDAPCTGRRGRSILRFSSSSTILFTPSVPVWPRPASSKRPWPSCRGAEVISSIARTHWPCNCASFGDADGKLDVVNCTSSWSSFVKA